MATLDVYNVNREKISQVEVDDAVFAAEVKEHLFYEVIRMQLNRRRAGTHSTKTRAEVSGRRQEALEAEGHGPGPFRYESLTGLAGRRDSLWP